MVKKSARRTHHTHRPTFKAKVALASLWEGETTADLFSQVELHSNQITEWKRQLLVLTADFFGGVLVQKEPINLVSQHAMIEHLTL